MSEITAILSAIESGESGASSKLLPLVYDELRKLAAQKLASERPDLTLEATALVHEAYLRLVVGPGQGNGEEPQWESRGHFFAAAAEAMRRILVENARRKARIKHGGNRSRVDLDLAAVLCQEPSKDLIALDEALCKLAEEDPAKAQVVTLRYFTAMTMPEIAAVMNTSLSTTERNWTYARTWLYSELADQDPSATA